MQRESWLGPLKFIIWSKRAPTYPLWETRSLSCGGGEVKDITPRLWYWGCRTSSVSIAMSQGIIDDQDKSRVKYSGNWILGGGSLEYDETVASSTVVGDSFTVTFSGTWSHDMRLIRTTPNWTRQAILLRFTVPSMKILEGSRPTTLWMVHLQLRWRLKQVLAIFSIVTFGRLRFFQWGTSTPLAL